MKDFIMKMDLITLISDSCFVTIKTIGGMTFNSLHKLRLEAFGITEKSELLMNCSFTPVDEYFEQSGYYYSDLNYVTRKVSELNLSPAAKVVGISGGGLLLIDDDSELYVCGMVCAD